MELNAKSTDHVYRIYHWYTIFSMASKNYICFIWVNNIVYSDFDISLNIGRSILIKEIMVQ